MLDVPSPASRSSRRGLRPGLLLVVLALGPAPERLPAQDPSVPPPVPRDALPRPLVIEVPTGLEVDYRDVALPDPELAELGRALFFDPRLSRDHSVACATCHRPEHAFGDDRVRSLGVDGQLTERHTPALVNRGLGHAFMWDGRATSLEEQALMPLANPLEMDLDPDEAARRLGADPELRRRFEELFGAPPDPRGMARALAAFVRTLTHGDTPVDRFLAGDVNALSADERAGMWVFEGRGKCWRCHTGANFSDEAFHNTGIGLGPDGPAAGRSAISGEDADRGAFKTPTLRALTTSAPYMHDGSLATLEDVVAFYRRGGEPNTALSPRVEPLQLSDEDARQLVAFLRALSRR